MPIFRRKADREAPPHERKDPRYDGELTLEEIKTVYEGCDDFENREISLGGTDLTVQIIYIDGVVSGDNVSKDIIQPLSNKLRFDGTPDEAAAIEKIQKGGVYSYSVKLRETLDDAVSDIVNGFCVILFENSKKALSFEVKSGQTRSVAEPTGEKVVKGAKDAFVETLRVNTGLIRKKIKNPDLKIKQTIAGRQTQTTVAIVYVDGLTNQEIVSEVEKRIDQIDIDGVLTAANIEEYLVDTSSSPVPQLIYTERVDKFCMNILEGRVGIIVDGLSYCYLAPATFAQFMKAPEDNGQHFVVGSAVTLLRYLCLIITLFLPGVYVAIAMYHQEMIPTDLMQSIIENKQKVPFPTPVEVLAMLIAFELLQEASVRMPTPVGDTLGMIGALIIGQSAVEARALSPLVVIVVALAGIAGFTVTNLDLSAAVRLCRLAVVIAAMLLGIYGLAIMAALFVYHLASLDSFGVPYLTPFASSDYKSVAGAALRPPLWAEKFRENALKPENKRRQK